MHRLIESTIAELERRIEFTKQLEDDFELAERLASSKRLSYDGDINIHWEAKTIDEVKKLLRSFAKEGCLLEKTNSKEAPTLWWIRGDKVKFCLLPSWGSGDEPGTCKLVKVGEYTATYPTYKLICNGKEVVGDEQHPDNDPEKPADGSSTDREG